jgi:hypothetical protein
LLAFVSGCHNLLLPVPGMDPNPVKGIKENREFMVVNLVLEKDAMRFIIIGTELVAKLQLKGLDRENAVIGSWAREAAAVHQSVRRSNPGVGARLRGPRALPVGARHRHSSRTCL